MSERRGVSEAPAESIAPEIGVEAFQASPEFRGPVESLDGHTQANGHFALIYESQAEQFAAAIPFVQQGLERDERCLYITYETSRDEVLAAMRAQDIDVDAALDSGQLSIHGETETYLRNGSFDADETIAFLDAAIEEATDEFDGLRVTGEMSSVLDEDAAGEELVTCEAKANYLFDDADGLALCQYNRERFPADVIHDVISTHPLLVHDNRVSHNVYYTPPEEFFGPDKTARKVDRLLGMLRDQTDAKATFREREAFLRESYEITSDASRSFDAKLDALCDLGCEQFGFDLGGVATVDAETDRFEVEAVNDDHDHLVPGRQYPLSETYCRVAADDDSGAAETDPVAVTDPVADGFDGTLYYEQFGVRAYFGTYLEIDGGTDRTFWFVSNEPRDEPITDTERTFLDLLGQWVTYELERREREQELRERTEHLSALVETAPECIKTVGPDGTLLQMNPAGLEMAEVDSASAVIGECVYDFVAPEHRERYRTFNERICQGERGSLEFDIIGAEGTRRRMETHAAPLRRPDGTTVQVALTRDVTERIERERELERALDLLEKTERIADVGGWEIDTETSEVFWTEHVFELLDVPGDEEPPLDEALEMFHEADQPIVEDAIQGALDAGEPFDVEVRLRAADSNEVPWLRLQGIPETVDDEVVSLRGAAQDITGRKQREQRLEEVIDRLEASNERLEQFAYAASHDLQEPLRMVSSYLQLLERRYTDDLDEDAEEYLEFAVDGADRMRAMIEGLLAYSRVETQGDPLEPVALDAFVDDVLSDLQVQIAERHAEISVDSLPRVQGDPSQLHQVFQNLLENAITYSGDEPPRVDVSADRDGAEWVVSVRDEGIGIDPDEQDRIFEVFQRLHSRDEYSGTGIGLALCKRIIERHGGDIWVESEPGEGTTFSFTLPASDT